MRVQGGKVSVTSAKKHRFSWGFSEIFYGLTRQKLNFLESLSPVTFGIKIMTFHKVNIAAAVRHSGGSVDGLGCSVITDETIKSALYQKILMENVHQ